MAGKRPVGNRRTFTPDQANAALPLVKVIVQDISNLARNLRDRQERLARLDAGKRGGIADAYREELQQVQSEMERDDERMHEYLRELADLGVELKDPFSGLIDFPGRMNGRDVYLCWRLGEPEVAHWHDLDAGFAGRQKLKLPVQSS
jgi:hypothetical protein